MQPVVERIRKHIAGQGVPPPASTAEIEDAERQLAFPLPNLLRELYATVADGGFGPSYGLLPFLKAAPDESEYESVVVLYALLRCRDRDNPSSHRPERLLPFIRTLRAFASSLSGENSSKAFLRHTLVHYLNLNLTD